MLGIFLFSDKINVFMFSFFLQVQTSQFDNFADFFLTSYCLLINLWFVFITFTCIYELQSFAQFFKKIRPTLSIVECIYCLQIIVYEWNILCWCIIFYWCFIFFSVLFIDFHFEAFSCLVIFHFFLLLFFFCRLPLCSILLVIFHEIFIS